MAVTAYWYGKALEGQFGTTSARRVDWATDTIKVALCTPSFTPNQDTQDFYSDITDEVANGNGYTTGGTTLGNKSVNYDSPSNVVSLRADDVSWTTALFTCQYAVIYKDTGSAATSPLLGFVNLGPVTLNNSTFTISWDANGGVLKIEAL